MHATRHLHMIVTNCLFCVNSDSVSAAETFSRGSRTRGESVPKPADGGFGDKTRKIFENREIISPSALCPTESRPVQRPQSVRSSQVPLTPHVHHPRSPSRLSFHFAIMEVCKCTSKQPRSHSTSVVGHPRLLARVRCFSHGQSRHGVLCRQRARGVSPTLYVCELCTEQ